MSGRRSSSNSRPRRSPPLAARPPLRPLRGSEQSTPSWAGAHSAPLPRLFRSFTDQAASIQRLTDLGRSGELAVETGALERSREGQGTDAARDCTQRFVALSLPTQPPRNFVQEGRELGLAHDQRG